VPEEVPWWAVASSAAAPALLTSGWAIAGELQTGHYDPIRQSVSVLAGLGATDRWVMTLAFVITAFCYLATGIGLRAAAPAGRFMLVAAGLVGLLVAASPEPASGGFSLAHAASSTAGFMLLAAWPLGAWQQGPTVPWALRPAVAACAVTAMMVVLAWFLAELATGGGQLGLAERVAGEVQAVWPLIVVFTCRLSRHPTWRDAAVSPAAVPVTRSRTRSE
jgi:uncharacterized protein DUF998